MPYPDRQEILNKLYLRKRDNILLGNLAIKQLEFIERNAHKTAYLTLSRVPDPDVVVIYTYGGTTPHHFYFTNAGKISDKTVKHHQFTWDWIDKWLDQGVAVVIFDVPSYFMAYENPWVTSFYRASEDRLTESFQLIDIVEQKFSNASINWFGISYGAQDAANISLHPSKLRKIVSASATWHVINGVDKFQQGARLDWYNVADSKCPVLIVMHEKEVFRKAQEEMLKTDSILVANFVPASEGHFFAKKETEVVQAICDWYRDKPIPKIIQ
jgi:hypothetical protein